MGRTVRRFAWIAVALAAIGAVVYAFLPDPVPVDVAAVSSGPLVVTVNEDGRTRIKDRYVVSSPLQGRLVRIELDPGDPVVANQTVLAVIEPIDPSLLDARQLAEAQARVLSAEAAFRRAEPELARADAAFELARSEHQRLRDAAEKSAVSRQELEEAEIAERMRAEERRSAEFAMEIARYELEVARAALTRTEPDTPGAGGGGRFEIRSPISGRVLRVLRESSGVVEPAEDLLEIGDPEDLELEIDVLSVDAVRISPGDRVIVDHWGGDAPLRGIVRVVEPSAFTKISALGVEEQRVNVIIDLVDPPDARPTLGDGFRVEAGIVVWESADALRVPVSALFRAEGRWAVFAVTDGRARIRPITIGRMNSTDAQVLDGLAAGDLVILYPSDRVRDGVRVRRRA